MLRQLDCDAGRIVLVEDGHGGRTAIIAAASTYFIGELGWDPVRVEDALIDRPGLIARAWMLPDGVTFGQEHHDGAAAVSVVHVDSGEPAAIDAAHLAADRARMAELALQAGESA
jgi:hypothetical protein